jgi:hypothetical protein
MYDQIQDHIDCFARLGATMSYKYDVVTNPDGSTYYGYTVEFKRPFADHSIHHHRHSHVSLLVALQESVNELVRDIEDFNKLHPGY